MPVILQLLRYPRTRGMQAIIRKELITAYENQLWPALRRDFESDVADWVNRPKFAFKADVDKDVYIASVSVDKNTKPGQIYLWVNDGTMDGGDPSTTYPIEPVNADTLDFVVPYQPKTLPNPPSLLHYNPNGAPVFISTKHVDHPGIVPRRFNRRIHEKYRDRSNPRSYYKVTENAYRRGLRKVFKQGKAVR